MKKRVSRRLCRRDTLSLPPKVRAFRQRGGRVCAGNPEGVSCTMMIPVFQNFLKL